MVFYAGPAPAPAKGTSAALIIKEKPELVQDKWDARFSNITGSTITVQVSIPSNRRKP
jgi:transglutaminase 1